MGERANLFKPAVKRDAKLRFAISGPAGAGKTFTLLRLASELAAGGRIAYVDTEHGSASKYAHTDTCGGAGTCTDTSHFSFDVIEPSNFDPRNLMDFIRAAVDGGYKVICVDSLSHYWMGQNGELELVDAAAKRDTRGNSFAAWKTVTPIHNSLVDMILSAPLHVMVSMRTKTEWVVEKDEKTGKSSPRKVGLAPVMRDGIEFEFDVCGDIDQDNNLTVTKSRCSALTGKVINRPGPDMASILQTWLQGAPAAAAPAAAPEPAQQNSSASSTDGSRATAEGASVPSAAAVPKELENIYQRLAMNKHEREGALRDLCESLDAAAGKEFTDAIWTETGRKHGDPDRNLGSARIMAKALFDALVKEQEAANAA